MTEKTLNIGEMLAGAPLPRPCRAHDPAIAAIVPDTSNAARPTPAEPRS